jgi:mannose-6-phosphate isomerase-like protein (cupin superfamily)
MYKNYIISSNPFVVPTTDGKLIEEFFGLASQGESGFSVAHMKAPAGWSEPHQTPDFDEITIMIKGKKLIEFEHETVELLAGQCIWIKRGTRLRYSNPFDEANEYWAICIPAFTLSAANRENLLL